MMIDAQTVKSRVDIERVAQDLYGLTFDERGRGRCYFHDRHTHGDADPSLHLDREHQRLFCRSQKCFGEKGQDVIGLVQTIENIDFQPALDKLAKYAGLNGYMKETPAAQIVAKFDYRDEDDQLLFQVVRQEPGPGGHGKTFKIRRPDGKGGWIWKSEGMRWIPYRLPELVQSADPVVIVEGEKHVDALRVLGFTATTNPCGAGKWKNEYSAYLEGRDVILWPDKDAPGRKHVQQVARSLASVAASLRLVDPPDELPEKGDVVDGIERLGWTREQVQAILDPAEPWQPGEVIADEDQDKPTIARSYHLTDLGNAERLIERHGANIRYCYPAKAWFLWDGQRWAQDQAGQIAILAQETVRSIYAEASQADDDSERKALVKHGQRSENRNRLDALIYLAQSKVPIQPEDMDTLPWLLNCKNGTLDLKTSNLYAPRQADLLTKTSPVAFDPNADCPLWKNFLNRIMDGNQELIQFLRRAVGYSLTGSTREQCLFLLYGLGANGKSTFLETLEKLMGEYGQQADFSSFLVKRNQEGPRNDIARLKGARFVAATEAEGGARLSEVVIKQLTGGDTVAARFLHQEFFEFKPEGKIWLATNHKPLIHGTDNAIWRRIRLIPFGVTIPPEKQDRDLPAKLRGELPGILTWAVTGCLEWQEVGLGEPDEVHAATAEYREEMDVLGEFLDACCVVHADAEVKAGELFKAYKEWSEQNSNHPMSQRSFGQAISERGIGRTRRPGGGHVRVGIGLKTTTLY